MSEGAMRREHEYVLKMKFEYGKLSTDKGNAIDGKLTKIWK